MESRSNLFLIDHNNLIHSANSHEPSLVDCMSLIDRLQWTVAWTVMTKEELLELW